MDNVAPIRIINENTFNNMGIGPRQRQTRLDEESNEIGEESEEEDGSEDGEGGDEEGSDEEGGDEEGSEEEGSEEGEEARDLDRGPPTTHEDHHNWATLETRMARIEENQAALKQEIKENQAYLK
ncbi:acidic leucine-rich nuclear phosphoprotein 32-related protein 2-like [Magnolia sinica]|uniref:acidic leucine-rich nuclear phosphoprotein 32-related protein 2-like n=1 Tax=Magnolia sinica TaxID=86752 RepID=UPI0026580B03|nr:acidic leucine-rich nuclear phosphoprotein 32-related protein 2-like [Magnolia sinica]